MVDIHWWLQLFSLVGCLSILAKLISQGMARTYPIFASYLLLSATLQSIATLYGSCSTQLCFAFLLLEPLRNLGYLLAILELMSAAIKDRPNLSGVRLPAIAAGIVSVGLMLLFAPPGSHIFHGSVLRIVRFERALTFGLAVFATVTLYSASGNALKLPRNSMVLFAFWIVWLLGDTAMLMSASILPADRLVVVNDGLALFEICSYAGWILLLSNARAGEGFGQPAYHGGLA